MSESFALGMLNRLGKAAAACGLFVLAMAAVLSGTDRVSREFPYSPSFSGWPYDTGASRAKAILAFVQTGPRSAYGYTHRAILSDPLSVQNVSILGRLQLYSGQPTNARKTFEVAGQLGWRDPMSQIYWLDQAMQLGDLKVAAERLDALLRQAPDSGNRDKFLAVVSASPEGRAALAERLKLSPVWAEPYLTSVDIPPAQLSQRVDVARRVGRRIWTCAQTAPITQKLVDAKMLDQAQSIWRQNCISAGTLVYDGGFDALDTTRATRGFDWQLSGRGDVAVRSIADQSGNRLMELEVESAQTQSVLKQLVVLKPGNYRLTWRTPDTSARSAMGLSVSLSCQASLADAVPGSPIGDSKLGKRVYIFSVDAKCPARDLIFWLAPKVPIHLDDVFLQPL